METRIFTAVNKLIQVNREHKRLIEAEVAEIGISRTGHRILMYLAREGKLPSQKRIAERFEVTPAAITGALKRLECDGYIERKIGEDNRFNEITITDAGRAIVEKSKALFALVDKGLFLGFSEEEIDLFTSCLERIISNIKG